MRNRCHNCIILWALTLVALAALPARSTAQASGARAGASAFAIESAGGILGSAAGFGLGVLLTNPENCASDDLSCTLEKVAAALAISAVGSGLGTTLLGRQANTRPSAVGAFLGAVVGIVAGVGVVHLVSEELDLSRENAVQWIGYTVTQGVVTALGSRLFAALRD